MAFRSNDCWRIAPPFVGICGTPGLLKGLHKSSLKPGLEMTLPTQTNGTRPVKTPVPPRTWVERSPFTSQLNPNRGENNGVAPGSFDWSTVTGSSSGSNAGCARDQALSTGSVKYIGKSTRSPSVRVTLSEAVNSSCT